MTKQILSVQIIREEDCDADTSFIGKYSDELTPFSIVATGKHQGENVADIRIDEDLPMAGKKYRFFNSGSIDADYTDAVNRQNAQQDYKRLRRIESGDTVFISIKARATIQLTGSLMQTISSGGLYGIESNGTDADDSYLSEIEREELDTLKGELSAIGFTDEQIGLAFARRNRS